MSDVLKGLPGEAFEVDGEVYLIKEWGGAVEIDGGKGDQPEPISEDLHAASTRMLLRQATVTGEQNGITWTEEPKVLEGPTRRVLIYEDYDDEGNGLGEPVGHRWVHARGWYGRGYQRSSQ